MTEEYINITKENSNQGIEKLDIKIKDKYIIIRQNDDFTYLTFEEFEKIIKEYEKVKE